MANAIAPLVPIPTLPSRKVSLLPYVSLKRRYHDENTLTKEASLFTHPLHHVSPVVTHIGGVGESLIRVLIRVWHLWLRVQSLTPI